MNPAIPGSKPADPINRGTMNDEQIMADGPLWGVSEVASRLPIEQEITGLIPVRPAFSRASFIVPRSSFIVHR